jgi:hypothetical protein
MKIDICAPRGVLFSMLQAPAFLGRIGLDGLGLIREGVA